MHITNRELLASASFEDADVARAAAAAAATQPRRPSSSPTHATAAADDGEGNNNNNGGGHGGQEDNTSRLIKSLKLALHRSIVSISEPAKQRPLNPRKDFAIASTIVFSPARHGGSSCCGSASATRVRRAHFQHRSHAASYTLPFLFADNDDDDDDDADDNTHRRYRGGGADDGGVYDARDGTDSDDNSGGDVRNASFANLSGVNTTSVHNNNNNGSSSSNGAVVKGSAMRQQGQQQRRQRCEPSYRASSYVHYNNSNNNNNDDDDDDDDDSDTDDGDDSGGDYDDAAGGCGGRPVAGRHSGATRHRRFAVPLSRMHDGVQHRSGRHRYSRSHHRRPASLHSVSSADDEWGYARELSDFTFTDFAPMCYCHIRGFFHIEPQAYLNTLLRSTWHSIPTPGKSSARLFFCGRDWVIKSMKRSESRFLRRILQRYYNHVRDYPCTLLPHFVGHHRLTIGNDTLDLVIMKNVFATTNSIDEKFDLKGSTVGRFASAVERQRVTCTQKDLDLNTPIHVPPAARQLLLEQIRVDCSFLRRCGIIDYSLLVGIHVVAPAAHTLLSSSLLTLHGQQQQQQRGDAHDAASLPCDARCFTACDGGMRSSSVAGLRDEVYYIGIIDILQEYNTIKTLETLVRGTMYDRERISCVPPPQYATRFVDFVSSVIV